MCSVFIISQWTGKAKMWIYWKMWLPGNLTSREIWLPGKFDFPGKCDFPENLTSREIWLPEKCDFLENAASWEMWFQLNPDFMTHSKGVGFWVKFIMIFHFSGMPKSCDKSNERREFRKRSQESRKRTTVCKVFAAQKGFYLNFI